MSRLSFFPVKVQRRWLGRIALVICGGLAALAVMKTDFAGSGTLLASKVWAEEKKPAAQSGTKSTAKAEASVKAEDEDSSEPLTIFPKDQLESIADSLKRKQRELESREAALRKAEQHLEDLRKETEQNLARIEQVLEEMKKIAGQADDQRQKEIKKWVDIYQAMPPEKAGQVIQGLEPGFAMDILAKMDAKKAGKILACVAPDKAIELGKKLGTKHP
jgi:flagellar motility protein MotE (MotC chaperone)